MGLKKEDEQKLNVDTFMQKMFDGDLPDSSDSSEEPQPRKEKGPSVNSAHRFLA
jgi:hypothetical protein